SAQLCSGAAEALLREDEVEFQRATRVGRHDERGDERLLHTEDSVCVEERIVGREDVRCKGFVGIRRDRDVDVSRAHQTPPRGSEELSDWPVRRNRIWLWTDGMEPKSSLGVRKELYASTGVI